MRSSTILEILQFLIALLVLGLVAFELHVFRGTPVSRTFLSLLLAPSYSCCSHLPAYAPSKLRTFQAKYLEAPKVRHRRHRLRRPHHPPHRHLKQVPMVLRHQSNQETARPRRLPQQQRRAPSLASGPGGPRLVARSLQARTCLPPSTRRLEMWCHCCRLLWR